MRGWLKDLKENANCEGMRGWWKEGSKRVGTWEGIREWWKDLKENGRD